MKLNFFAAGILLILCFGGANVFSQDVILLQNGTEIKATVSEIDVDIIKYKKFENLTGPVYTIKKSDVVMITYANGTKDVFIESKKLDNETSGVVSGFETQFFTDARDGKTYKMINMGTQIWMAENLAYIAGGGCWAYDNDIGNVAKYGYLYNYEIAKTTCPAGWHLPTDAEWQSLINFLGGNKTA